MLNHSTGSSEAGRQGESPAAILSRGGDAHDPGILNHLSSASLTGQELDLVDWGHCPLHSPGESGRCPRRSWGWPWRNFGG